MPRLFGTNGVRGVVNEDMNIYLASNLGSAIGTWLAGGKVAIATDTRTSNEMLKSGVISGLLSTGCSVVDLGCAPTPVLQYHVKLTDVDHGIVITASHNPPNFNGIKCVDCDGTELSRKKEEEIEALYFNKSFERVPWDKIGGVTQDANAIEDYIKGVIKNIDSEATKSADLKVVLDCGNGAGSLVSPYLLERMGCKVVTLNAHPQGTFPGHESEPTPENLKDLIEATVNFGADLGIAHDGDADRTIIIDEKGNYLYGDRILALVTRELLRENNGGVIVTTVASSLAMDDVVKDNHGEIIYTKVGSPIVARKMMETNAIFGGEENGGLIFPKHQFCRDGGMAAAKVVEIIAKQKKPLSDLIAELPKYHLYKTKVVCPNEKKESALKEFAKRIKSEKVDLTDGVKILSEDSWVLVRPSGTEPIYRIFAEAKDVKKAEEIAEENKKIIADIIKKS
ncbi:MAG: phosphoglucosamine mutase [Thermoplasmata archaeon]|nr:MAG: phosphoglucosamine mutase [Thermoplasmata archaeon]